MTNPYTPNPVPPDYRGVGIPGVPDVTPDKSVVPPPPQVDYRQNPNTGQVPSIELGPGGASLQLATQAPGRPPGVLTTPTGPSDRDQPYARGSNVAPQPQVGHRGYTINQLDAPPNKMVPCPGAAADDSLSYGNVSDDPTSIGAWDFWETV